MSLKRFGGKNMKRDLDDNFNEENLNREIKKVKRKSIYKIFLISIIVSVIIFTSGNFLNRYIFYKYSLADLKRQETIVRLTIPNGVILESYHDFEFLGGKSYFKIGRQIGEKSVILEDRRSRFGILPGLTLSQGGSLRVITPSEEPVPHFWENGYRQIIYYHPDIEYKRYKDDLSILDEIPDGKLIEMGLSFDEKYKPEDINIILPDVNKSWIWLDLFTDEAMDKYKYEAENYDASTAYIDEYDILGISSLRWDIIFNHKMIKSSVLELLDLLKESPIVNHNEIFTKYCPENNGQYENPMMLGAIVYGTKDELKTLIGNPHIKASSIGVVTDIY